MVKRRPQKGSYQLWLEAEVHAARYTLPGNLRQRVKQILADLRNQPRPAQSQSMDVSGLNIPAGVEIRPSGWSSGALCMQFMTTKIEFRC
jgi:hypothetical protein